jgi:hypothetical protein
MGEEVASSTPHAPCRPPSREAARPTLRRLVEIPSATLSQPAPNGPLVAARELLRNPPDAAAPPDMLRQWRDDVDRLLILAQFTPGSVGGSTSRQRRRQGGAFGLVHAELNRRRVGEDARVSIERAHTRQLNIEGRNLESELDAAVPKPRGLAQAPVVGVGCAALADHLRAVAWPS